MTIAQFPIVNIPDPFFNSHSLPVSIDPCLVSAATIADPGQIELKAMLNGEMMQY